MSICYTVQFRDREQRKFENLVDAADAIESNDTYHDNVDKITDLYDFVEKKMTKSMKKVTYWLAKVGMNITFELFNNVDELKEQWNQLKADELFNEEDEDGKVGPEFTWYEPSKFCTKVYEKQDESERYMSSHPLTYDSKILKSMVAKTHQDHKTETKQVDSPAQEQQDLSHQSLNGEDEPSIPKKHIKEDTATHTND